MANRGESLVAVRDRREQVIDLLSSCFANDLIDIHEFERRVELAEQADSIATLDALTSDLSIEEIAGPDEYQPGVALAASQPRAVTSAPEPQSMLCVLGGTSKRGQWTVPRTLRVWALMGGAELDFREARFGPGTTEVKVRALMGGAEVIVPPGLEVDVSGVGILGGFEDVERTEAGNDDPDRPRLRITGLTVLGGVEVSERLPGETAREARRRRRRLRKELREQRRAELKGAKRGRLGDGK